jgi:hypothetical protein
MLEMLALEKFALRPDYSKIYSGLFKDLDLKDVGTGVCVFPYFADISISIKFSHVNLLGA